MRFLDVRKYSNHLDLFKLSYNDIEDQITEFKLSFISIRNKKAEWGVKFPTFLDSFYKFVYNNGELPTQEGFYNYYLNNNKEWFAKNHFENEILLGLKARIYRTYPSLIRDLHFSKLIVKELEGYEVIYNTNLDVKEGIDLLVMRNNIYFAVNLYTKTARALIGREKKETRHIKYDNIKYIELPVEFKDSLEIGDFFLYGRREVDQLKLKLHTS
jgi:hypothetical protein